MNKTFINNHRKEILKTAKAHTFPYHRYTREEINSLNVVNLVELCVYLFENKLIYTAGRLVLRYHPHVIVYAEGFYDTKTHKCHNAINGLKLFFSLDFLQACYIIKSFFESEAILDVGTYITNKYPLAKTSSLSGDYTLNYVLRNNLLDYKDNNSLKMVFSVLHNRMCIDRETIKKFLKSKKLIVNGSFDLLFLEYEDNEVIAITSKLQHQHHLATEILTTKRNTTFTWDDCSSPYYHNVYVFEDVYQIMSYLTLINKGLVPALEENSVMLSLNGIGFEALETFLDKYTEVKHIYACLSNTSTSIDSIANIPFDKEKVTNMQYILKDYSTANNYVANWGGLLQAETKKQAPTV